MASDKLTRCEEYLARVGESHINAETHMRDLGDDTYVVVRRLVFHWTINRGYFDDTTGYFDRWCYVTEELALEALQRFVECPPAGFDPLGWHRHPNTGRRRPGGDPAKEYIEW